MKYVRKSKEDVEAIKLDRSNYESVIEFVSPQTAVFSVERSLDGVAKVSVTEDDGSTTVIKEGQYIVKDNGGLFVWEASSFEDIYEKS